MSRIRALDGLRGVAILSVLLTHHGLSVPPTPAWRAFESVATAGSTGVDLFFVLSGYLITLGLLSARGKPLYLRGFYWRRLLRIVPLAYLVLIGLVSVMPRVIAGSEWAYWLFLSNWAQGFSGKPPGYGFSIFWSLAIEEQFYLVWPLLVLSLGKRWLTRVAMGVLLGSFAARTVAVLLGVNSFSIYVLTPFRLDGLAVGALIAIIGPMAFSRWAPRLALATGALLLAAFLFAGEMPLTAGWFQPAGYSLLAIFYGSLLVVSLTQPRVARLFEVRPLILFGTVSYCLYLIHDPLRIPIQFALQGSTTPAIEFVVWIACALAVSCASWRYLESPLLRLKTLVPTGGDRGAVSVEHELAVSRVRPHRVTQMASRGRPY